MSQLVLALAGILAAVLFPAPDGARAQAASCTPTLTVSPQPDENGVYTTTVTCADTAAAAGETDYGPLVYRQATASGSPANNNADNHAVLTVGPGLVFSAEGHADFRSVDFDAILRVSGRGDNTIIIEEGAVLYLRRTPEYWCQASDSWCTPELQAARPAPTPSFDPAQYRSWSEALTNLAGAYIWSGSSGAAIRHRGVIELDSDTRGTFAHWHGAGNAVWVHVQDNNDDAGEREKFDAVVELGPRAVIRQAEGADGVNGIYAENRTEDGDIRIDLAAGSLIDVSTSGGRGMNAWILPRDGYTQGPQTGDILIDAAGTVRAAVRHSPTTNTLQGVGISAYHSSDGRVRIDSSGTVETWQANAILVKVSGNGAHRDDPATAEIEGHLIDLTGGKVHTRGGTAIYASTAGAGAGVTVRVAEGATVRAERDAGPDAITREQLGANGNRYVYTANVYGWREIDADGDGENDALEPIVNAIAVERGAAASEGVADRVVVHGTVEAVGGKEGVDSAIFMKDGGAVFVGATGRVSADSGLAVSSGGPPPDALPEDREEPESDLEVTVAGRVEGDVRVLDAGALTFASLAGSTVAGTVHDPAGPLTVAGSVGRLLYTAGGTVTVARTGALTGVEADGKTEALRSETGDLDVTVAGRVAGDLRPPAGGALTLSVPQGGVVMGTAHDPAGPLTIAGSIGRLLYSAGGTVTVAETGRIAGVEGESDAIRSESGDLSVTVAGRAAGDIRARGGGALTLSVPQGGAVMGTVHGSDGPLKATVAGTVTGDIRAARGGALNLEVPEGGVVTGTVHDPAGPLTVAGSIGRLLYSNGGTVAVAATGRLAGVDGVAIRSESGDLDATVAGMVTGDVLGLGDGDHAVTVSRGGTVTGTIRLAASTVRVDGSAGCVRLDNGGMVTVGATGRIACADGAGVRSETGDFTATVAGAVTGDVLALGSGEHRVAVAAGARVTGAVRAAAAGSAVAVAGTVGKVRLDRGGAVTLGEAGRVTGLPGDDGAVIRSDAGELAVTIRQAPGETVEAAAGRVEGRIEEAGGVPDVSFRAAGSTTPLTLGAPGTEASLPIGAFDLGVAADGAGVRFDRAWAPRARVYEALPSVLLGLNEPSGFHERTAAPRSPNGVWARAEASGGSREAKRSTSAPGRLSWRHRGYVAETGLDIPLGDGLSMGVSAHHRRIVAEVSADSGSIDATGNGLGASLAFGPVDGVYVDGRVSATWFEAGLGSGVRGSLKRDAEGFGHAVGVEAGRRVSLGPGALGEVTVTPRVGATRSHVDMDAFTDRVGSRVSVAESGATTARAGVRAEASDAPGGSLLFGSVDVEREFSPETRVRVSGTDLASESEATRVRMEVGGSVEWGEGRYALHGAARYATGAEDYGGRMALRMRF